MADATPTSSTIRAFPLNSLMPSHAITTPTSLPVYHPTKGALGGAGFPSFEVNLSYEISITRRSMQSPAQD